MPVNCGCRQRAALVLHTEGQSQRSARRSQRLGSDCASLAKALLRRSWRRIGAFWKLNEQGLADYVGNRSLVTSR